MYLDLAYQQYEANGTIILNPRDTSITDLYLADVDWLREFWTYVADRHAAARKFQPVEPTK